QCPAAAPAERQWYPEVAPAAATARRQAAARPAPVAVAGWATGGRAAVPAPALRRQAPAAVAAAAGRAERCPAGAAAGRRKYCQSAPAPGALPRWSRRRSGPQNLSGQRFETSRGFKGRIGRHTTLITARVVPG